MPHEHEIDESKPEFRKEKFGNVQLDCIMLDQRLEGVSAPPLGLFPTFCLDPGKDSFRMSTELGSIIFVRNQIGTFQKHVIAIDVSGSSAGVQVGSAHVSTLSTTGVSDADFVPGPELQPASNQTARIAGGVVAGNILTKVQPVYPQKAKLDHVSGRVVLHAIIGRDGRVQALHLISTPDSDLAIAAITAVRKWTYKPYLLNGLPTEVDTTITVNFSFRPG